MGSAAAESSPEAAAAPPVYGHKLSTVVPWTLTGEGVEYQFGDLDLAAKAHYVRAAYCFRRCDALDRLTVFDFKQPMFPWLDVYYPVTGRVRLRAEEGEAAAAPAPAAAGRPFVKCNDCGVRIIEASCGETLDEWLETERSAGGRWKLLLPDRVLGPELQFSPFFYVQFTKFKCGGLAIGMSWAHVLGDPVAAADCFNLWGQLLCGNPRPPRYSLLPFRSSSQSPPPSMPAPAKQLQAPPSVKQVELVGDRWFVPPASKMATFSVPVLDSKLKQLRSGAPGANAIPPFELISAALWSCLAKVRWGREPSLVTVCRHAASEKRTGLLGNELKVSTVSTVASPPAELGVSELATLLLRQEVDETKLVENLVAGGVAVVVYGANLTFVDMEGVDLYGLELPGGQKPVHVDMGIDGVGDEGAVLVFGGDRRCVQLILPVEEMPRVREMLRKEFDIA